MTLTAVGLRYPLEKMNGADSCTWYVGVFLDDTLGDEFLAVSGPDWRDEDFMDSPQAREQRAP